MQIRTEAKVQEPPPLFQSVLADLWELLPERVKQLHRIHGVRVYTGQASVTRGSSIIARFAAWFFNFPQATDAVSLTVTKTRTGGGEIWERNFGGRAFRSFCAPAGIRHRYREKFWLFNYEQQLSVTNGAMHLPVVRGWFCGIPLPRFLLPWSESREYEENGVFHFDVSLGAPLGGGLIVRYRGSLLPEEPDRI